MLGDARLVHEVTDVKGGRETAVRVIEMDSGMPFVHDSARVYAEGEVKGIEGKSSGSGSGSGLGWTFVTKVQACIEVPNVRSKMRTGSGGPTCRRVRDACRQCSNTRILVPAARTKGVPYKQLLHTRN